MPKSSSSGYIKLRYLFSFVLILAANNTYAQRGIDDQVQKGLNYCYNFEWGKAEQVFEGIIKKHPEHPAGYHYLSSVFFWYYMSNKQEGHLNSFLKYSDLAIEQGKKILEKEEQPELLYIIGSNYTYRAIAFAKDEEFLDAAWATKESESYLSELVEKNPKFYDAYLGLGLYNFAIAQIPAAFKWVLSLAGISGNQSEGLKYITLTAEQGKNSKVEAQYYLSQIYSEVFYDYKNAAKILDLLLDSYPDNTLFIYSNAVLEMKRRNLEAAEVYLRKIFSEKNGNFKQLISFSNFLMGDVYFRKNQFQEAVPYYQKFLGMNPGKDYSGIAAYRLALCFELSGSRSKAAEYYSASGRGNQDLEDDIFAKVKGSVYAKRPLSELEKKIIKNTNLLESGNYSESIENCLSLLSSGEGSSKNGEIYLLLSDAYFWRGETENSKKYADLALKSNDSGEKWIQPYAYFYLARGEKKLGNISEARYYADEAGDYSGYLYENKLKNLVKSLLIE